jgi:hypothetical protein
VSGTNAGTGQRITARCFWCARAKGVRRGYRLYPTGKRRYRPLATAKVRVDVFWQYHVCCPDCERVGWSRHIDIARRFKKYELRRASKQLHMEKHRHG